MKQKKESFFKKLLFGIYNKQDKNIDTSNNYDFNSQIEILKSFMSKKDWQNSFNMINKLINKEKENTLLLLSKAPEKEKAEIKRLNLDKLNLLLDYERDVKNNIKQEQNEKALRVIDNKIIYVKNRIDFHSNNENHKKALEVLNSFYDKNKDDEKAISFYNKEKAILDVLLAGKKTFFGSLFGKKSEGKETGLNIKKPISNGDNNKENTEKSKILTIEPLKEDDKKLLNQNDGKETSLLKLIPVSEGDKINQTDYKQEKNPIVESIKKEEIKDVPNEIKDENQIENIPEIKKIKLGIKMDGVNDFSTDNIKEENKPQIQKSIEKQKDEKITDNVNGFLGNLFSNAGNKDVKNVEKVINLMESFSKIKDLDKAISKVEEMNKTEENLNKNILKEDTPKINEATIIEEKEIIKEEKNENKDVKEEGNSGDSSLFGIMKLKEEKKFDIERVIDFEGGIKAIKYFIKIKDWERAKIGIEEVKKKEEKAFNLLYDKIDLEQEKKKQKDLYNKKLTQIDKLIDEFEKAEEKYNKEQESEKFKVKFSQIKEKLDELMGMKKYYEAMDLLNSFFEENKDSIEVIEFFNKWKNIIQKKIKKQENQKEKEFSKNTRKEAEILIGENINFGNDNVNNNNDDITGNKVGFFRRMIDKLNLYKKIKNKLKEKRLIDEVTLLIDSQNEVDELSKKSKLESMHSGLIKEIDNDRLLGYDLYAKILGKDKISGDTFGFIEDGSTYKFFLGDATGHGIQAGLIVTLLTRLFHKYAKENFLEKVVFEVNNGLKQDLKSGNFITGIFFEIDKTNLDNMKYVGMGHEPILIYRKNTMKVEKLVAGGLASGIRLISSIDQVKNRNIKLYNEDIVFVYSDGIVESRNIDNKLLLIDGLSAIIEKVCVNSTSGKIIDLYNSVIEEVKSYRGGSSNFFDDATIFIMKRNTDKDLLDRSSPYLKDLSIREGLSRKHVQELEGNTREEVEVKLQKIRKEKKLKLVIDNLEKLYITGEILKLKQEAIRYIKEGYIHKKINRYLKKAITNERQYKIDLKSQKMKSKYVVLKELLRKGDYNTVIKEANEIIASDGNITI